MNNNIFKCPHCGCNSYSVVKKNVNQYGLYCNSCRKWIKWLGKSELAIYNNNNANVEDCSTNELQSLDTLLERVVECIRNDDNIKDKKIVIDKNGFTKWKITED